MGDSIGVAHAWLIRARLRAAAILFSAGGFFALSALLEVALALRWRQMASKKAERDAGRIFLIQGGDARGQAQVPLSAAMSWLATQCYDAAYVMKCAGCQPLDRIVLALDTLVFQTACGQDLAQKPEQSPQVLVDMCRAEVLSTLGGAGGCVQLALPRFGPHAASVVNVYIGLTPLPPPGCAYCGKICRGKRRKCGGCWRMGKSRVVYCDEKCQKADWPSHKATCTLTSEEIIRVHGPAAVMIGSRRWLTLP